MAFKKVLEGSARDQILVEQLQYLYSKRSAVELLIRSLENYARLEQPVCTLPPATSARLHQST